MAILQTKKTARVAKECVACGACVKVCSRRALAIFKGIIARVDCAKCIGCGKCAQICPANVITVE